MIVANGADFHINSIMKARKLEPCFFAQEQRFWLKEYIEKVIDMKKVGLVLEGGGQRIFTSGVLDAFMEKDF